MIEMSSVVRVKILDVGIADAVEDVHTVKLRMSRDAAKILARHLYEVVDLTINGDSEGDSVVEGHAFCENHYRSTWRRSHPGIRTDWILIGDEAREQWRNEVDKGKDGGE